ncbi:hypothetical protein OQZ33_04385 [Pedobacter sp. MC2016-05]|uniref:hypothetical protein n=1 Tax=Pedobacter sp. MC2016-05 TaxID=2994474 RepID=UPI002247C99B|nr:hypothetical protein [Pedobacter sp. MC2016-05]MCX2473564.1 hypothetical protein [Pedobacter sp. MC2016-05]
MQDFNAWLQSGQNYDVGLALYAKHGQSDFLKKLFADGPTPFNKSKLVAELSKLAPTPPAIPEILKIPVTELSESKAEQSELAEFEAKKQNAENHKYYLAFQEDNKTLYRQIERNMFMLDASIEQPILLTTAKNILHLHKKIKDNYRMIDHFDEVGYFPFQKTKVLLTDEAQLIYQSLSKARKRLASGICKDAVKTKKLIESKLARLAEINGKAADE